VKENILEVLLFVESEISEELHLAKKAADQSLLKAVFQFTLPIDG
jgi:hypothetical protein